MSFPRVRPVALLLAFVVSGPGLYSGFVTQRVTEETAVTRFLVAVVVLQCLTSFVVGLVGGYKLHNASLAAETEEKSRVTASG